MPKPGQKKTAAKKGPETSLGESVHGELRAAIRQGRYRPGQRIREAEIAQWLGVSRTPVREAFRRLQADGILTLTPWQGARVAKLERAQVVELYAMRQVLEGTAARLASEHASKREIDRLFDLLNRDRAIRDDPAQLSQNNLLFHETVYGGAHNRYLLQSLNALADSLALLGPTTYGVPGRGGAALDEHAQIAEAIRKNDADHAERAARAHIAAAVKARLKLLFDNE